MESSKETTAEAAAPSGAVAAKEAENAIVRKAFFQNEPLLRSISALLLGVKIDEGQKKVIRQTFAEPVLYGIVRKRFLPEFDDAIAIGQANDPWMGIETDIFGKSKETIMQAVGYKEKLIALTERAMKLLVDPEAEQIDLSITSEILANDPMGTNIMARCQYVKNVNQQIIFLWIVGNQKVETPKEKEKTEKKNSSK